MVPGVVYVLVIADHFGASCGRSRAYWWTLNVGVFNDLRSTPFHFGKSCNLSNYSDSSKPSRKFNLVNTVGWVKADDAATFRRDHD